MVLLAHQRWIWFSPRRSLVDLVFCWIWFPPAHAVDVVLTLDFVAADSRPDREQTAGSPMAGVSEGRVAGPPSGR
jgi:hypothetical protein